MFICGLDEKLQKRNIIREHSHLSSIFSGFIIEPFTFPAQSATLTTAAARGDRAGVQSVLARQPSP
jgi:hypothetical protein